MGLESRVQVERFPGTGQGRATFPIENRKEKKKKAITLTRGLRDGEEKLEEVLVGLKSRYNGSK